MRSHPIVLFLSAFPLWASCQGRASADPLPGVAPVDSHPPLGAIRPLAVLIDSLHLDAKTIRFHVDKSERRFEVFVNDSLLKTYPCVLGEKPVGDKFFQGDRKTPEGTFTFRSKRRPHQWHVFIWVDYPNAESYRRYKERKRAGVIPVDKDIGGEIGIHGVPEGMDHWIDAGQDWTFGCIALRNQDVDEIYPYIIPGRTTMEIVP
ncbi:MAG: L,D-transpeptidase family protein [Flavobacteriales bacterium]|nr:L,D-transpeptidase family protein [Flavobacteriales bacterium]